MRTDDVLGFDAGQHPGDAGTHVTTVGTVALMAQAAHQLGPCPGDVRHVPARLPHRDGEPVARQRGCDDVEGVGRVAAVSARVGERSKDAQKLHNRAGYPWLMISGSASGSGERTCRKWTFWPSMVVVNCAYSLSFASHWRQSYPFCQYSASSLRCPNGTPRLHPTPGSSPGQRVRAKRSCRSSTSACGMLTWKGRTLI